MTNKKILVSGGGGYIGSITTDLFLKNGFEVIVIDNFERGFETPLKNLQKKYGKDKLRYYKVDLRDNLSKVLQKEKNILAAVHFGALIVVDESMKDPQKYFSNNVAGSINFFNSLLSAGIKKVVFSSTAAVYSEAKYLPIDEIHPTGPANVYGQSKLMMEEVLRWYGKLLNLNYVIFRYFNICGASDDASLGYSNKASTHLIPNAVKGALGLRPFSLTCPTVKTRDKTPIRDYINVVDLAQAHVKAVNYLLKGGKSEIINLGTGTGNSVLEIIEKVQKVTGVKFDLQKSEPRDGETAKLYTSIKKAKKVLGWEPKRSLEDSVKTLVVWFTNHPKGWEK